jgi:signal transduction histidine kinase/ActR/RegA family two-component response regulator
MDSLTNPVAKAGAGKVAAPRSGLFRKYVVMLVSLVSLALAINGATDIWFSYQEQKALLFRIQREQAKSAAEKISQFLNEITAGLAWETQLPWSNSNLDEWQLDAVRLLRQVPSLSGIVEVDASGRERFRMSREAPDVIESRIDHSKDAAFIQAMAHKIYYGPVYFVDESQPFMTVAMAGVRPEFGAIIAQVNLTFIWDVVSQIKVGKYGQAYVVDDAARLIAHPDISEVLRKTDMSTFAQVRAVRAAMSNNLLDQPLEGVDLRGRHVLSAYARVAPTGWLVFADLPIDEAYAPLYDSALRSGSLILLALALAIFAGFMLARRMIIPIRALHDGAARIGSGDLVQRISIKTADELEALGEQFNRMAERLQDSYTTLEHKVEERTRQLEIANQAKSRFLATASHDLRQPLHALGLFVGQLHGRMRADERKRIINRIEAALSAMNDLFNALLDISKLDAGALTLNVTEFALERLIKRVEATFAGAARHKGLTFRAVPCSAWVRSDFILLERILLNLVSNAVRYTASGRVLVGCRRQGNRIRIEVWDTGPGIATEHQHAIFGEFYRLGDPDQDGKTGLGLGLAIVDRLGRLLNHPLSLTSVVGNGSCFSVSVPRAQTAQHVPVTTPTFDLTLMPSGKLVVIIDDDPLVRDGMSGLLQRWGCQVITAATTGAALARVAECGRTPDLIVSDYHLPGGALGVEAVATLRKSLAENIPAFLISGDTGAAQARQANARGLQLLHKPVDPAALHAMFAKVLAEGDLLATDRWTEGANLELPS